MTTGVMRREVAASMVEWQGVLDSATARGMTKFGFCGYSRNSEVWVLGLLPEWRKGRGMTTGVMRRDVAASMVE